jgi:hypothetical protein
VTIKAFDYSDEECEPSDTATGYSVMCCGDERPVVRAVSTKSCSELADSGFTDTPFGRIDVCGSSNVDVVRLAVVPITTAICYDVLPFLCRSIFPSLPSCGYMSSH